MKALARQEFLGHPTGLFVLFFVEMWERFSFYGMRALLVFYMVKELLYADSEAYAIYGAYGSLVYATPIIGGLLADRLLGYRRAIVLGGVLMTLGHFAMAIEHEVFFYGALGLLILGNGFFKPNISSLVGKLYEEGDERRDGGFTIFYMGINLGALLAPLTCGIIGEVYGWHWGFGLAGVGMLVGLVLFLAMQGVLGEEGLPPDSDRLHGRLVPGVSRELAVWLGSLAALPLVMALLVPGLGAKLGEWLADVSFVPSMLIEVLRSQELAGLLLIGFGVVVLGGLLALALRSPKVERQRMFVVLVLIFFSMMFWAFFEQAGSSISMFTDRNVDRTLLGWEIPASTFQSVNPAYIILLAPVFAHLWTWLRRRNLEPSVPVKFALGIMQLGLGFGAFVLGAQVAGSGAMVPLAFLLVGYLLHTTGELCLSPVGLSMVTKLAPAKIVGLVMGAWFLSSSFAHYLAGIIATMTSAAGETESLSGAQMLGIYSEIFGQIALIAVGVGVVCLALSPLLTRWMHGVR